MLFKTKHGVKGDPNSPFAQLQCESCHGPGGRHAQKSSEPIGLFGKNSPGTVTQQNEACLSCHSDNSRVGWHGSIHERRDLACVSCHKIHAEARSGQGSCRTTGRLLSMPRGHPRSLQPVLGASCPLRGNDLHIMPPAARLSVPRAAYQTDGQPNL